MILALSLLAIACSKENPVYEKTDAGNVISADIQSVTAGCDRYDYTIIRTDKGTFRVRGAYPVLQGAKTTVLTELNCRCYCMRLCVEGMGCRTIK